MALFGRKRALRRRVEELRWWHTIDLGGGVTTPGVKPSDQNKELAALRLPDLRGKTVLDVGAWDGFFSFAAERLGAERVVALDHYVWSLDLDAHDRYYAERNAAGLPIEEMEKVPSVWRPDELPGKRAFDLAHEVLKSRVEAIVGDFMTVELDELGRFDVVLYLGVLYHMRHPLLALERLARVTRELAVIETEAVATPDEERAMCVFFEGAEHWGDHSNWWVPNERAVVGMCRAAGFGEVTVLTAAPATGYYRLIAHARRPPTAQAES